MGDVFMTVLGVVLGLCGISMLLLGVIAMGERALKHGSITAVVGIGLTAVSLFLVGAIG